MIKRNIVVVDLETTGLNPGAGHEILQIGAAAWNYWDLGEHHVGTFNMYIKPENLDVVTDEARSVIMDLWDKSMEVGVPRKLALQKFVRWMEKVNEDKNSFSTRPLLIAHNVNFENRFLHHYLALDKVCDYDKESGDLNVPWSFSFDSMEYLHLFFGADPDVHSMSLDTFIKKLNISTEKRGHQHDAMEDVVITSDIVRRCLLFGRECRKRMKLSNHE